MLGLGLLNVCLKCGGELVPDLGKVAVVLSLLASSRGLDPASTEPIVGAANSKSDHAALPNRSGWRAAASIIGSVTANRVALVPSMLSAAAACAMRMRRRVFTRATW